MSEYDPLLSVAPVEGSEDLEDVREHFAAASRPYLSSPWSWLAWGLILPTAALATGRLAAERGPAGVLFLWSGAILLGGGIEVAAISRHRQRSAIGSWAMRVQGNLSLVALLLSLLLIWLGETWALPGLWLLTMGHSFYMLGSLALPALRRYGLAYQLGGVVALVPDGRPLVTFAVVTAVANLALAVAVAWQRRSPRSPKTRLSPRSAARR